MHMAIKVAIISLIQNREESADEMEFEKQIRQVINSSPLSKSWTIEHVAFLDDVTTIQENVDS